MRRSAPPLRLFASAAALVLAAAEPAAQEGARAGCEPKRQSCVAACRAQHFSIDPKRGACIANCAAEANRCVREQAAQPATRD